MASKPKLVYWDIRALAQPIRLLLSYLQVDFEDVRIRFNEMGPTLWDPWQSEKHSHGLDFPNLPFYIDEDVKLSQSQAILQYLGRKYNLYGDSIQEKATIDMIANLANDMRWGAWVVYNSPDYHDFKEEWRKTWPARYADLNKFMEGKEFVLGTKISYVDFLLYETLEWILPSSPETFEQKGLENLNKFHKRIEDLPQIKEYMASDKFLQWPIFAPIVNFGYSKDPDFKPMPFSYRNYIAKYPVEKL